MQADDADTLWITAMHEAAHAVADLRLGAGVIEVCINPDGTGYCRSQRPTSVLACLAGLVAEWQIAHPDTHPSADYLHDCASEVGDLQRAVKRLGSDDGTLLLACWVEAEKLVDQNWASVLVIALELQQHGHLDGEAVGALWRSV